MRIRQYRLLFAFLISITFPACAQQPTYSKEKIKESVIDLCKNEYDLDVQVKILGSTLGVYIPIEGLVSSDLKLNQKSGEKIEDVALSMHRVIMSTDKPLKFYTLVARDTKTLGAEFVLTGFVYDVVRVRLLDISRGEYHQRILKDFRFNPTVSGGAKIRDIFDALNEDSPLIQEIKHFFYPIFAIGDPGSQKIEIISLEEKELSEREGLFYVKTKEHYINLPGFEAYNAIFPPGFDNEYLILTDVSMFPGIIKEIVSKYFYTGTEIRQRDLKTTYDQYEDLGYIGIDGLPKKDLEMDWFLAKQIGRRIKVLFMEDKRLNKRFSVQSSDGTVDNKIFTFNFTINPKKPSEGDDRILFSSILKLFANAVHRYSFDDFEGVELIDIRSGGEKVYLSRADLERFRRGHIKIEDLI